MRLSLLAALALLSIAHPARAWDVNDYWQKPASGGFPGGGGIFGTGGARDYNITCANCHVKAQGMIDATFTFAPALQQVNGMNAYAPGQLYQVGVKLTGEHLGLANCDVASRGNINNFGAVLENQLGKLAGTFPPMQPQNTLSYLSAVVYSGGVKDLSSWSFTWQAPAAGAGTIDLFYGVVDGNCDQDSQKDDVKVGIMHLSEFVASTAPRRATLAWALLALVPAFAFAARRRR